MLPQNIINPEKKIEGLVFHLFYKDLHTSILFDCNLDSPIIHGNKIVVMNKLKTIDKLLGVPDSTIIKIYSYLNDKSIGYRKFDIFSRPIKDIGRYMKKF